MTARSTLALIAQRWRAVGGRMTPLVNHGTRRAHRGMGLG